MKNYQSFDLLAKMAYVRTGGSNEEMKCAQFLQNEVVKFGIPCEIVPFEIDGYTIKNAKLIVDGKTIECAGVGMSGSTEPEGITAPFTYVTSIQDAKLQDLEGKIALIHSKLVNVKIYKTLCEKKAAGIIVCTGSVYLENEKVDLDPYQLRDRHLTNGKIPAVCIRMKDAEEILKSSA